MNKMTEERPCAASKGRLNSPFGMTMGYRSADDDYRPLFYMGGYGFYAATTIVLAHVCALVVTCLFLTASARNWQTAFPFESYEVIRHGQIWRLVTYAFLHQPTLGFAWEMLIVWFCGREVERFLGHKVFLVLYGALLLTAPLVLTAWSLFSGPASLIGSLPLHFGIFIAYASIYPNVAIYFGIPNKLIAFVLLGIGTLAAMVQHEWPLLAAGWASVAVAYGGTHWAGVGGGFSFFQKFQNPWPKRPAPREMIKPRSRPRRTGESSGGAGDVYESIDPLLDKISKHGLASLSQSERATLERARVSLLRKERSS